jgi:hypothetical protein
MMQAKRSALADRLKTTAEAHGDTYKVENRFRRVTLPGPVGHVRRRVMGDPIRYIEVREGTTDPQSDRDGYGAIHAFDVVVFVEYDDADQFDRSSEKTFNELLHNESSPIGLLPDIEQADLLRDGSGAPLGRMEVQGTATPDIIVLDDRDDLASHTHSFTVTVE